MQKDCIEILKTKSPELHKFLAERSGVFDGSDKSKQAYIKAARELQDHSLNTINDIYARVGAQTIKPKTDKDASLQIGSAEKIFQRPQEGTGIEGSGREPLEQGEQGTQITQKSEEEILTAAEKKVKDKLVSAFGNLTDTEKKDLSLAEQLERVRENLPEVPDLSDKEVEEADARAKELLEKLHANQPKKTETKPETKTGIEKAKDLVNSGVVKGYSAAPLKDAANNDDKKFETYLSNIAEQAQDERSNKVTVEEYGQELVDVAKEMFPKKVTTAQPKADVPKEEKPETKPPKTESIEEKPTPEKKVKPATRPVEGKRKIRDEKLKKDIDDAWDDFLGGSDILTTGGLDPKKIEAGTKLVALYIKNGVYKFSDIIEDAYAKFGEKLADYMEAIKSVYSTYYNTRATDEEAGRMDANLRGFNLQDLINKIKEPVPFNSSREFIDAVKNKISAKEKLNIVTLRKMATDVGISLKDTELHEMTELAIVELAKDVAMSNISTTETEMTQGGRPSFSIRKEGDQKLEGTAAIVKEYMDEGIITDLESITDSIVKLAGKDSQKLREQIKEAFDYYNERYIPKEIHTAVVDRIKQTFGKLLDAGVHVYENEADLRKAAEQYENPMFMAPKGEVMGFTVETKISNEELLDKLVKGKIIKKEC